MSIKIASMNFGDCDTILHNTPNGMKNIAEVLGPNGEVYWSSIKELTGIPPLSIRSNGTMLLDYLISGNMTQTGTPTPTTPIQPQECGERTGNLAPPLTEWVDGYVTSNGNIAAPSETYKEKSSDYISIDAGRAYTFSMENGFSGGENYPWRAIGWYAQDKTFISRASSNANVALSVNAPSNAVYCRLSYRTYGETTNSILNKGSTALPYEPYGIKIPISSANTTTPVYLGEVETTRRIKKLVLTGQEEWEVFSVGTGRYFRYMISSTVTAIANVGICSHYKRDNIGGSTINTDIFTINAPSAGGNGVVISPSDVTLDTASDFKTYLQQQYANGTPVTVWYVLATPETGIVNEPLRKIGDYADTLSYEQAGVQIPTNKGNTVIDVETTLKPSQMYIKYK